VKKEEAKQSFQWEEQKVKGEEEKQSFKKK
jgi:hypothetical protein